MVSALCWRVILVDPFCAGQLHRGLGTFGCVQCFGCRSLLWPIVWSFELVFRKLFTTQLQCGELRADSETFMHVEWTVSNFASSCMQSWKLSAILSQIHYRNFVFTSCAALSNWPVIRVDFSRCIPATDRLLANSIVRDDTYPENYLCVKVLLISCHSTPFLQCYQEHRE